MKTSKPASRDLESRRIPPISRYMTRLAEEESSVEDVQEIADLLEQRSAASKTQATHFATNSAGAAMRSLPYAIEETTPTDQVVKEMARRRLGSVLIVGEGGAAVGVFSVTDALNLLAEVIEEHYVPLEIERDASFIPEAAS